MGQQYGSLHKLQKLERHVVVVYEVPGSAPFDGRPNAADYFEHPDDIVFDFEFYVRWLFPRHGEEDIL